MTQKKKVMSDKASVIESAMTQFRIVVVTAAPYVVVTGVSGSLYNSRFGVRGSIPRRRQKPRAETAKVASLSSLMTPNASAFGPMIPVMVTKILTVAFVSVVLIGLGVFVAYYAFELAFHFLDDD